MMFCCWHVIGVQLPPPHLPGTPPPPHVCGVGHVPQSSKLPQPSPAGPQEMFCCWQLTGVQLPLSVLLPPPPHWPGTPPPPHVCGGTQVPQLSKLPHPSPAGPQEMFCCWHVRGVQLGAPHLPATPPPPHVCGATQVPQLSKLPQPSPAGPQERFCCWQVTGVQPAPPHCPWTPAPPHVCGGVHVPQLSKLPQPSPAGPQLMFCCWQLRPVHELAPQGWQTPDVPPTATKHAAPPQQSALVVHLPHAAEHDVPQMNPGAPEGFGMQGRPLQQSALVAHAEPAPTHVAPVHRGTPTLSCRHVTPPFWLQLPEQQSHDALQEVVESLQTSPFGLHPWGLLQIPRRAPAAFAQDPAWASQQSESPRHVSPTTWHPLAGWQM